MTIVTVQKLAKEIGIPARDLYQKLVTFGYEIENIESKLTTEQVNEVKQKIGQFKVEEKRVATRVIRRRQATKETGPVGEEPKKTSVPEVQVSGQEQEASKKTTGVKTKAKALSKKEEAQVATKPQVEIAPKKEEPKEKKEVKPLTKIEKEKIESLVKAESKGRKSPVKAKEEVRLTDFTKKVKIIYPKEKKVVNIRSQQKTQITTPAAHKRVVRMKDTITVGDLAKGFSIKTNELIAKLVKQGMMVTVNHPLDFETASLIATDYKHEVVNVAFKEHEVVAKVEDKAEDLKPRPPVVTIMGHVDHGKTTLLDAIRKTNVAAGESGGITQHIGAYQVLVGGRKISFIDTPGHAAFAAMRSRGARVTDIVVLVVAADDGVMPQTKEAATHAKEAGVAILVAANKMDAPGANLEKIKQQLTEIDLMPEEWGGKTILVPVSAKKGTGLKELLDMILLQADVLELKANPHKQAKGVVLESKLDAKQGSVITLLVKEGTLKSSDYIVSGIHSGKVRALRDDLGKVIKEAPPSMPVEVLGLSGSPAAGDDFFATVSAQEAQNIVSHRIQKRREASLIRTKGPESLEELLRKTAETETKELKLIVKADVQGSVEALSQTLEKLSTEAVKVKVIYSMVGGVTENDVHLALASHALIIAFHVRPESNARRLAEEKGVIIKPYKIIYEATDEVKQLMTGLLEPVFEEQFLGRAEVRNVFNVSKVGAIAGCQVLEGLVKRSGKVRLLRDNVVVHEGRLASLKRFKDDVREVQTGFECGLALENFNDIKVGDVVEIFEQKEIKPTL